MCRVAAELSPLETSLGFAKTPQIRFPVAEVKELVTTDEVIYKY